VVNKEREDTTTGLTGGQALKLRSSGHGRDGVQSHVCDEHASTECDSLSEQQSVVNYFFLFFSLLISAFADVASRSTSDSWKNVSIFL